MMNKAAKLVSSAIVGADFEVVEVNGINEIYYFHVIYRETHSVLAALIGSDIREGFEK